MSQAKSTEYRNFEELTRKLISVPKTDLDSQLNEYTARKVKAKSATKKRK